MDNGISIFGYSRKAKRCGAYLRKCVMTVVLWIFLALLNGYAALWLGSPAAIGFAVIIEITVILLTLPNFRLEYDYEIEDGVFTVAKINGGSRRKVLASFSLRDAVLLAPLSEDVLRKCEGERPARALDVTSGFELENRAAVLFPDEKGRLTLILFDANERFFKAARFYCPAAMRR